MIDHLHVLTGWNSAAATTTAGAAVAVPVGTQIQLGNGAKLTVVARNGNIIGGGSVSVSNENDRPIANYCSVLQNLVCSLP